MSINYVPSCRIIIGGMASGKTYYAKQVIFSKNFVVYDVERQYALPNSSRAFSLSDFFDCAELNYKRICYSPDMKDWENFDRFCGIIYSYMANLTVVFEELGAFNVAQQNRGNNFKRIIDTGRHRRIDVICLARSVTDIPPSVYTAATEIITFRQTRPQSVKYIEDIFSKQGIMDELNAKPDYWHVHYDVRKNRVELRPPC